MLVKVSVPRRAAFFAAIAFTALSGCAGSQQAPVDRFAWSSPQKAFVTGSPAQAYGYITPEKVRDLRRQTCAVRELEKRNGEAWIGSVSRRNAPAIEQDDRTCRDLLGPERVASLMR